MTQPLFFSIAVKENSKEGIFRFVGKTMRLILDSPIKFVTLQYITFTNDQSYDSQQPRRQPSQARNHWLD